MAINQLVVSIPMVKYLMQAKMVVPYAVESKTLFLVRVG